METKIKLKVQGLTNSQVQSGAYALILSEEEGPRRIPVIVGVSEAQSIALELEGMRPPRPMTHDLFVSFAEAYHIKLKEVIICRFEEGVFYSEMIFLDGNSEIRLDSRTSDAVAIALRMKCNIYTLDSILKKCGIILDENPLRGKESSVFSNELNPASFQDKEKMLEWLRLMGKKELEERMTRAIEDEKYEDAKIYREELLRRAGGDEKS